MTATKPSAYKDMNDYSWPIYRTQQYVTADATYTIQYICDAAPDAALADAAWRVKRVRYITATNTYFDTCWAVDTINTNSNTYNKGTANFMFPATNLWVVSALTYNQA